MNGKWGTFDRVVFGVAAGGLSGIGFALLHAIIHVPRAVPGQPLANEWWPLGVMIVALVTASCGNVIGILVAVVRPLSGRATALAAMGGAGLGLVVSYLIRGPSWDRNLFVGCLASIVCAFIGMVVGAVVRRFFSPRPNKPHSSSAPSPQPSPP